MKYEVTNIQMFLEPDEYAIERDREHLGFSNREMWDCIEKMQADAERIIKTLVLVFPTKPEPDEVVYYVDTELRQNYIATNCFDFVYDEGDEWYEVTEVND